MIRFVVALTAEARPLIRRFGLARDRAGDLPFWRGDGMVLGVCGVGRVAAATATAQLAAEPGAAEAAWLNVGIGGHRSMEVGRAVLAHKVVDETDGRAWYPPLVFELPCATATVTSVARPETAYPEETVYEMEAAGFCAAASRFASAELIQVIKVISDNAKVPADRLNADRVEELIGGRLDAIALIAEQTASLAVELDGRQAAPAALAGFVDRWHFTVTQRRRLERLLRRLGVLEAGAPEAPDLSHHPTARAVLAALEERLASHAPGIG